MRQDLSVYNEATGFTIHSGSMNGNTREELDEDLCQSVRDGLVIPIELVQDNSLVVRVLVNEDLTPEEDEEWVGKIVSKLQVPCGKLVVEGGFDPDTEDDDEFTASMQIPPGDYRVEVYALFYGINGDYCCGAEEIGEPLGTWFRRTRPGVEVPDVLKAIFGDEPELDPGHEDEWEETDGEMESDQVDFIIRLTPLVEELPALVLREECWFEINVGARKPERCPIGVATTLPPEGEDDEVDD
jgi:hypothetical protein